MGTLCHPLSNPPPEAMLQYVKAQIALMVENAEDFAITAFDLHYCTTLWNPGAARMFGYRPEEILGQAAAMIFTPEDRRNGIYEREFETAARIGRAEDERWHMRKDGSRLYVSGVMMAVKDESGALIAFAKIARDITSIKHAQEMLTEALGRAEAANAAKTEFLNTISHEIRNPLHVIMGLADILLKTSLMDKQREYIETLRKSGEMLLSLVDNLLDMSKIEARTVELETISFSLSEVLGEIMKMMAPKAAEKRLSLTLETQCIAGYRFQGDPARIRQIILNLCSNALKFTEKGGIHIRVTTQPTDRKGIAEVCINVEDTGIGIPPDKMATIFNQFTQADSSISRRYGGTGLGLAIAKKLAELMGGTISINSDVGKGTIFTVCLSLALADG